MTRVEAEALFVEKEGHLCLRYYQRADGTILLKDCAIGLTKQRRRRWIGAGTTALLAAGGSIMQQAADRPAPDQLAWRELAVDTSRKLPPQPEDRREEVLRDILGNEYEASGGLAMTFRPEELGALIPDGTTKPKACAPKKR